MTRIQLALDSPSTADAIRVAEATIDSIDVVEAGTVLILATILAVNLAFMVGGTVIIESIFAIPGIGSLIVKAIFDRDYPIIQGVTLAVGVMVLFINLLTDLSYAVLDPRIKY